MWRPWLSSKFCWQQKAFVLQVAVFLGAECTCFILTPSDQHGRLGCCGPCWDFHQRPRRNLGAGTKGNQSNTVIQSAKLATPLVWRQQGRGWREQEHATVWPACRSGAEGQDFSTQPLWQGRCRGSFRKKKSHASFHRCLLDIVPPRLLSPHSGSCACSRMGFVQERARHLYPYVWGSPHRGWRRVRVGTQS